LFFSCVAHLLKTNCTLDRLAYCSTKC